MTAKELREKFEYNLKKLQDSCNHENLCYLPYHFAPGHYSHMVNVCDNCEKIIETSNANNS